METTRELHHGATLTTEEPEPVVVVDRDNDAGVEPRTPWVTRGWNPRFTVVLALTSILGVATFLRLYGLDRVGFNSDEAVYSGQAASIAGAKNFTALFPIYLAHPLLFQSLLSVIYRFKVSDFSARLLAGAFGVGTVAVCYALGKRLYGRRAGIASAAILAVMPYHVIVSRQVLLDGAETFFATLTLYLLATYASKPRRVPIYATGAALGLTVLAKETGGILLLAVLVFFALSPSVSPGVRHLGGALATFAAVAFVYPLTVTFGGASTTGGSFFLWQLVRPANHSVWFYFQHALPALGLLVLALAIGAIVLLWRDRSWRETLLLTWALVPLVFFTLWPTKGYQYLLPIAPPVAVLAGRAVARLPLRRGARAGAAIGSTLLALLLFGTLVQTSWSRIELNSRRTYLAGTGGVPGGRAAGTWLTTNTGPGARLLALGPSMANILEFYGHRTVWGLSVSTNAAHRNPVYQPLVNPDLAIRRGDIQYLVWDAYSANRAPTFAAQLLRFVARYNGHVVHTESVARGNTRVPVILIYRVQP